MTMPTVPGASIPYDPTYEPEELSDTGGSGMPPIGPNTGEIVAVEADFNFESRKQVKGVRWCFTWAIISYDKSKQVTTKAWMDNTSQFGASLIHNMFINIGIPYTVPNPNEISKSTGLPRKSFMDACLVRNIDGSLSIKQETFLGKTAIVWIRYIQKCQTCNWSIRDGTKMNSQKCGSGDMAKCEYELNQVVKCEPGQKGVFFEIDTTTILPLENFEQPFNVDVTKQAEVGGLANDLVTQNPITPKKPEPLPTVPSPPITTGTVAASTPVKAPISIYTKQINDESLEMFRKHGHVPETGVSTIVYMGTKYTIEENIITNAVKIEEAIIPNPPEVQSTPPVLPETPTPITAEDDLPF